MPITTERLKQAILVTKSTSKQIAQRYRVRISCKDIVQAHILPAFCDYQHSQTHRLPCLIYSTVLSSAPTILQQMRSHNAACSV